MCYIIVIISYGNRITCNLIAPFCYLPFSIDTHFGTVAGSDVEIPILKDISDGEEEKKPEDEASEVSSTQAGPKVPQK